MYADTNERPGLDEQYLAATNTSDLTLNMEGRCAADHLIAAGVTGNRMGDALNHLRSQWASADKPPKPSEEQIAARAETLPKRKGKVDIKRARVEAVVQHASILRGVYMRLPGRMQAMMVLTEWAAMRNVDPDLLSPSLYHWLNPGCPACEGRGKVLIHDTPVLGKDCHHCAGSGKWPRPLGAERVQAFLARCVGKARIDRRNYLQG